jgi:hypothetical protein
MIKFELACPFGRNSEGAVVYFPGQTYVMLNGAKIRLDRVLCVNANWVGCVFGLCNSVSFIEQRGGGQVILHTANTVTGDGESAEEQERRISELRLKQAAVLLKAVKHTTECVGNLGRLIKALDQEAEGLDGVKLGLMDFIRKRKECVQLEAMERTLQMIENESLEIIHEELDIPAATKSKRARHSV